ncbi:MAG: ribosomal-processing cysteine protease Prp [Bacteroides sp.]|nr:ribosomal-processing cysteine protease Prp [Roseburia sp.]MCM1462064.1 ribosomal-processing cysteine protease Prp [Bacteroides sp.]
MIKAEFLSYSGGYVGFSITGHAGAGEYGHDIVCSAVTSAVMLTVNMITDYLFSEAEAQVGKNKVLFVLKKPESATSIAARQVIASFKAHLAEIEKDSPGTIRITEKEAKARKGRE